MFCCIFHTIWVHSGPFGCLTKLGGKRAELVQKFVPRNRVGIFPNKRTRSTPLDSKLTFWCVFCTIWVHSGPFGCLTKLGGKRAELVQKFVPRSRIGIFRNERNLPTQLDPKLTFWCVLYYLGVFGTVWLPYQTLCKTSRTSAKVRATKSRRNFSHRTHPIHPIGLKTDILVRFVLFWCIRDRLVALRNSVQIGRTSAKVRATKSHRNFSQRTCLILPVGP